MWFGTLSLLVKVTLKRSGILRGSLHARLKVCFIRLHFGCLLVGKPLRLCMDDYLLRVTRL